MGVLIDSLSIAILQEERHIQQQKLCERKAYGRNNFKKDHYTLPNAQAPEQFGTQILKDNDR